MRVVVVGAGPIGVRVAEEICARPSLTLCGVVDVDPRKIGIDVAGARVTGAPPDDAKVAVLTTTSSLEKLTPLILDVVGRGMAVVSTCEELAWPWTRRALAERIDAAAKERGVAVLGTGVNPGFLMDALPLFLTAPCRRVERVRVERVQDASARRRPFQDKVGVGLAPDDVRDALRAGKTGHVGLKESAALLAARLGFAVDGYQEQSDVVVAGAVIERAGRTVLPGQVLGVEQIGRASAGGSVVVELSFRAVFGQDGARDHIVIDGDPALDVTLAGGVHGDVATASIVVNAIPAVMNAAPGLRTMADVPLVSFSR